jgi:hypothetical protein
MESGETSTIVTHSYLKRIRYKLQNWSSVLIILVYAISDRLCDLVVTVLGHRSGGPGSIPDTTRKK